MFPIHVLTTAALSLMRQLNREADWDVRRFRPNVLVETDPSPADHVERAWLTVGMVAMSSRLPGTKRAG